MGFRLPKIRYAGDVLLQAEEAAAPERMRILREMGEVEQKRAYADAVGLSNAIPGALKGFQTGQEMAAASAKAAQARRAEDDLNAPLSQFDRELAKTYLRSAGIAEDAIATDAAGLNGMSKRQLVESPFIKGAGATIGAQAKATGTFQTMLAKAQEDRKTLEFKQQGELQRATFEADVKKALQEGKITADKALSLLRNEGDMAVAKIGATSREQVSREDNATKERVAEQTNATRSDIAEGNNALKASGAGKPATATQFAAAGYGKRIQQANSIFSGLEAKGFDRASAAASAQAASPDSLNSLKSPDVQSQQQAERNFVTALLRRESGAAISESEFATAEKLYFPRHGDAPEVKEQKRASRQLALDSLMNEAGNAWDPPAPVAPVAPIRAPAPRKTAAPKPAPAADPTVSEIDAERARRAALRGKK